MPLLFPPLHAGFLWTRANAGALLTSVLLAGMLGGGAPAQADGREAESRPPAPAKTQVLEVGQPLEGEVAGGQSLSYQVTLAADQYLDVVWELRGSSMLVSRLFGADGELLFERNGAERDGRDGIMWIAEKPGEYRVELAPVSPDRPAASYAVNLVAVREATPDDRLRIQAQTLSQAAQQLRFGDEASRREAISKFEKSLGLWRAVGDTSMERDTLLGMGEVYRTLGETDKSLEVYHKAVPLAHSIGNVDAESVALTSMGTVYADRHDLELALDCYERSDSVRRTAGLPVSAANIANIAGIHQSLGEWQQALDAYREALRLVQEEHDRSNEAIVLDTIGRLYLTLGEYRRAVEYYMQALFIRKAMNFPDGEVATLVGLAEGRFELGERADALGLMDRALGLVRQTGSRRMEEVAVRAMARIQYELGAMHEALTYARQALSLAEVLDNRWRQGQNLNQMGMALAVLGRPGEAVDCFQRALALLENGDRRERLRSLYELARVQRDRGRLPDARAHLETALAEVESLRTKVTSQGVRASYFALIRKNYELYIDVLMRLHRDDPRSGLDTLAFEVSERARARALLELLSESAADIREGVDRKLLDEERLVRRRLSSKTDAQMRLLGAKASPPALAAISRDIDSLASQLDQIEVEIRQKSPRYAALTHPRPLALPEIQAAVLDADTALLEYAVGEEQSFLWVVTATSVNSHELPGRRTIEGLVQQAREALSRRPAGTASSTGGPAPDAQRALAALGRVVLGPAGPRLAGKRLLIVADDALQYIPFAALSMDEAGAPLVADHEIVTLPSASVLPLLRRERTERRSPTKMLAVFADPVFEKDDERVRSARTGARPAAAEVAQDSGRERAIRAAQEVGLGPGSMRLPFTGREARAILSLVAAEERKEAIGFDASREAATGSDLAQYRFVHFATHGFVNAQQPELSGVVLSLIDRAGREQDGFLSAADIFNLQLSADLVVLSGCRTALGKDVRGEGLVGLTRAFMYAGAGHVMASLWNVDDAATAELMKRFYGEMLGPRRSSPAAALRAAQRGMRDTQRWRAPFYWSGFVIQGDWN